LLVSVTEGYGYGHMFPLSLEVFSKLIT